MKLAGRRFRVSASNPEAVSDIIAEVSRTYGFDVSVNDQPDGKLHIQAINQSFWLRIILFRMLQRVDWRITPDSAGDTITLQYDRRWFMWFRVMVGVIGVPIAIAWYQGFMLLFENNVDPSHASWIHSIAPWVGIITMLLFSLLVLTYSDSIQYQEKIRRCLREHGLLLDTLPNAWLDRITITALFFLAYGGMATVPVFLNMQYPNMDRLNNAQILTFIIVVLFLTLLMGALGALFIGVRRLGADERFAALMPSTNGMLAILFFLGGQMGVQVARTVNIDTWKSLHNLHAASESAADPSVIARYTESLSVKTRDVLAKLQKLPSLSFGALAGTWMLSLGFIVLSIRSTRVTQQICRRIQTDIPVTSITAAASASGYLLWFRIFHIIMWVSYVILSIIGMILLFMLGVDALIGLWSYANLTEQVNSSSFSLFISYAFTSQPSRIGIHCFFVAWAMVIPAMMMYSVINLILQVRRRQTYQRQLEHISVQSTDHALVSMVHDLKTLADHLQPIIVISNDPKPLAQAHGTVLSSDEASIEVSYRIIEILETQELKALLAHELAHHVCGHCRKHELMKWLGRFTLVGDTFVGALEDSFGYEMEADRVAVTRFRIPPQDLRNALLKMQVAILLSPAESSSDEKQVETGKTITCRTMFGRLRDSIRTWLALYKGDPPLSYWHPSFNDRLLLLEEYEKNIEICRKAT